MAIKFEKVKAGDVLFDIHRYKMGNTTMTALGKWDVKILSVDDTGAEVSWNGNRPERWSRQRVSKLFAKEPPSYTRDQERRTSRGW